MKSSAAGPDYISLRIVKSILPFFVQNFVDLLNGCFKEGSFPNAFKRAKIVPLFKQGDPKDFNNYRPISLLSTFSRVMEKLIFVRVDSFLSKNWIFFNQFGFRRGYSTEDAIHFLTTTANDGLDNKLKVGSVFLDILKAFDACDHLILLKKLE